MTGLITVANFLINLLFSLMVFVLWIRIILRYFKVSSLHPFGSNIYNLTSPIFSFMERSLYPNNKFPRYDWLSLAVIILLEMFKFILLGLLLFKGLLPIAYILLFTLAELIITPCNLLFYALIIRVVLSWVNSEWRRHPAADILIMITDPLIVLGRKIIPNISGFDFAPYVMMIILKIITLFISASLPGSLV